jgi:hypothetical protein
MHGDTLAQLSIGLVSPESKVKACANQEWRQLEKADEIVRDAPIRVDGPDDAAPPLPQLAHIRRAVA